MKTLLGSALAGLVLTIMFVTGCSVPNLEEPACKEARDIVREFYSFHFGNDMHPTPENLRLREKWLSKRWALKLGVDASGVPPTKIDYFTQTEDFPKAFRVGECKLNESGNEVLFDVLLFWKDDTRTEQKHISVGVRKENDTWRIDSVSPADK